MNRAQQESAFLTVKSSRSVFQVLRLLAAEKRPLEPAAIAKQLSIPMTSMLRVLSTLEAAGYAERERATGKVHIGRAARTLSLAFMSQFAIRDLGLPYLQRLTLETDQTSSLFVRLGWNSVRVAAVLGERRIIHHMPVGQVRRLCDGAHGNVILAAMAPDERAAAVERLDLSPGWMEKLLHQRTAEDAPITAQNVSEPGTVDCAWPLVDRDGRVIASVGFEGVQEELLAQLLASSPATGIVRELAAAARRELDASSWHYNHIPADDIEIAPPPN